MSWRESASGSARRSCGSRSGNESGSGSRCWSSRKAYWAKGGGRTVGRWSLAKGSSWMVGNRRESRGGSQKVGPAGCPPTGRGSDSHGPHPARALRGRAGSLGAGSWSQAASGSSSHPPPQGTSGLQPCSPCCLVLSPGHPGCKGHVRGGQSAY